MTPKKNSTILGSLNRCNKFSNITYKVRKEKFRTNKTYRSREPYKFIAAAASKNQNNSPFIGFITCAGYISGLYSLNST